MRRIDRPGPPDLVVPAGTAEEQTAWIRARIDENLKSGDPQLLDLEMVKKRGRERLAARRAA